MSPQSSSDLELELDFFFLRSELSSRVLASRSCVSKEHASGSHSSLEKERQHKDAEKKLSPKKKLEEFLRRVNQIVGASH